MILGKLSLLESFVVDRRTVLWIKKNSVYFSIVTSQVGMISRQNKGILRRQRQMITSYYAKYLASEFTNRFGSRRIDWGQRQLGVVAERRASVTIGGF